MSGRTSESIVGSSEGKFRARVVRRPESSKRWDVQKLKELKGTPWGPMAAENLNVSLDENTEKPDEAPPTLEVGVKARTMNIAKETSPSSGTPKVVQDVFR